MRNLAFLARVTLICNLCFAIAFLLHHIPLFREGVVFSTVLIMGHVLAIVFNVLFHAIWLVLMLMAKPALPAIPRWIIAVNLIFLIFQVIHLVK
jgi:hypothetical protein